LKENGKECASFFRDGYDIEDARILWMAGLEIESREIYKVLRVGVM
jgi:hypothetical protein